MNAADVALCAKALKIAEREKGVTEHPAGSNRGPRVSTFQKWDNIGGDGYAWCCSFAWCYAYGTALGHPVPFPTASVGAFLDFARKQGWVHPLAQVIPGALIPFEFTGDVWPDHIGLARGRAVRGELPTIEGNTSFDGHGSQSNGGCVAEKMRAVSLVERGVCIIPTGLAHVAPHPTPKHVIVGPPGEKLTKVYTLAEFLKLKKTGTYHAVRRPNGLVYYEKR